MDVLDKLLYLVLGAALTWVLQQYRLARSEDVALVNEHIKDIERFAESAQTYWLKRPIDREDELHLAAKVRAHHAATTLLYEKVTAICTGRAGADYAREVGALFLVATGGDFESLARSVDPQRAIQTYDRAAHVVHILRLERADIVSISRVLRIIAAYTKRTLADASVDYERSKDWRQHGTWPR